MPKDAMSIREMDKLLPADCFGFPEICLESDDDGVGGESARMPLRAQWWRGRRWRG